MPETLTGQSLHPGVQMLRQMAHARRFNRWMAETLQPFLSGDILEIGAGIGNLTEFLCNGQTRYLATDSEQDPLTELKSRLPQLACLTTAVCDAADPQHFTAFRGAFDTVICLNVLEHIADDETTLSNIYSSLRPSGKAIVLVPQGAAAFGTLDKVLAHQRRYSESELAAKMTLAGFDLARIIPFNRATYPGWLLNSRLLRRRTLSDTQLRLFDFAVPLWRRLDSYLPWPPTSLIAVGVKR